MAGDSKTREQPREVEVRHYGAGRKLHQRTSPGRSSGQFRDSVNTDVTPFVACSGAQPSMRAFAVSPDTSRAAGVAAGC